MQGKKRSFRRIFLGVTLCVTASVVVLAGAAMAQAQQEQTLYTFQGKADGGWPEDGDGLVADAAGNFYGVARTGGKGGRGVVFKFAPPSTAGGQWTETVLHSFPANANDGSTPIGGVVFDAAGNLYGTTAGGGEGVGTVYELSPPAVPGGPWTETILYSFQKSGDGYEPLCGVVFDKKGNLYGATYFGGALGAGTVYRLSPPAAPGRAWTEKILHSFKAASGKSPGGENPDGGVIVGKLGEIYGTAVGGGRNFAGVVFRLTPPVQGGSTWREDVLYNFTDGDDGGLPSGDLARDPDGNLYGVTLGTLASAPNDTVVFKLTPPTTKPGEWIETTIHQFRNEDGPLSITWRNGMLYGTTGAGDTDLDGSVFQLAPQGDTWVETVLHKFVNTDGHYPTARPAFDTKGNLYGLTEGGGDAGQGVLYEIGR